MRYKVTILITEKIVQTGMMPKLQYAISRNDSAPRSLDQAHYKLLTCCAVYEEKLIAHKSYMSVRQAYKKLQSFP